MLGPNSVMVITLVMKGRGRVVGSIPGWAGRVFRHISTSFLFYLFYNVISPFKLPLHDIAIITLFTGNKREIKMLFFQSEKVDENAGRITPNTSPKGSLFLQVS